MFKNCSLLAMEIPGVVSQLRSPIPQVFSCCEELRPKQKPTSYFSKGNESFAEVEIHRFDAEER